MARDFGRKRTATRMPFGKHKGERIDTLPSEYLEWLLTLDDLRDPMLSALQREVERRARVRAGDCAPRRPDPGLADELIGSGVRSLARRYHPDVAGGTHEKMLAVNACAEWLRKQVRELPA